MKSNFLRNLIGILIVIVVFIITAFILFRDLSTKSLYKEEGSFKVSELYDTVFVYKDAFGVPHIEAKNQKDLFFILGYIHAQDRLWEMDFMRRVSQGKLSEIFGKESLEYDKLFRTIGIYRTAKKYYNNLPNETKEILESYSEGVNYFIDRNKKSLPLEFDVLDYKPDKWAPIDCFAISRLMAWNLNISWYTDYCFGKIIEKFGFDKAEDFIPDIHPNAPNVIKSADEREKKKQQEKEKKQQDTISSVSNYNTELFSSIKIGFVDKYFDFLNKFGTGEILTGSNAWAVSGKKSESGKPLIANDPHLPLQIPSTWYEVEMIDKSKNFRVAGFSIPGIPGILIGLNNSISWGITNLMNDEMDLFMVNNHDNVSIIDSILENISVKGKQEEISYTIYLTKEGPIVSNLEKTNFLNSMKFQVDHPNVVVMKWVGYDYSDEITALYNVNNANNWSKFKSALKSYGVPALNFVYADTAGNIGYCVAGKIPIRKTKNNNEEKISTVAIGINNNDFEWKGYVDFEELPSILNPPENYIVTANNRPQAKFKYYITNLFEPHYRAARIEELLEVRNNFSTSDFQFIQLDVNSLLAKEFCNYLFKAVSSVSLDTSQVTKQPIVYLTEEEKDYLQILKNWNYEFKLINNAATIFAQFEIELYKNLYKEKLGDELFLEYITIANIPIRNTSKLLREKFINVSVTKYEESTGKGVISKSDEYNYENLRDALIKSFKDAIAQLKNKFKTPEVNKWVWGEVHKVKFKHPLGVIPALSQILEAGPYEADGCGNTVCNIQYSYANAIKENNFYSYLGPSLRFIADLSNLNTYFSILPPGQNGQNISLDYRNQVRLWLNGEYKQVYSSIIARGASTKIMTFLPTK
ncbi:MAG: penicillin acylase family protein [Ignavibacteria bacterium]|nr:penicillin acylase family protein [Ignavibacteria bacterium]